MNTWTRFRLAVGAALSTYRQVYTHPEALEQKHSLSRKDFYNLMLAYYSNTAFEDITVWLRYIQANKLYRYTRSIYNPVTKIVDFYAEHLYAGVWNVLTEGDNKIPDSMSAALPLGHNTPQPLRVALQQLIDWSNWQSGHTVMVTNAAMTGNALTEIVDQVTRRKVTFKNVWAGLVDDLDLDGEGNIKRYVLEYMVRVSPTERYKFRKVVDGNAFQYFKDDKPFDLTGEGAVVPNHYGFVPATWTKHLDAGSDNGVAAVKASLGKIDELNSEGSALSDYIRKRIKSPRILWSDGVIKDLFAKKKRRQGDEEQDELSKADVDTDQDNEVVFLKGPKGGSTDVLVADLDIDKVLAHMATISAEIERDYPELTMYDKLREMTQVTGPAAERLMGDVRNKVQRAASNYDVQMRKLLQMGVAIAGDRLRMGEWELFGPVTSQHHAFDGFGLDSYSQGALDFTIMPRPLVPQTSGDAADELGKRATAVGQLDGVVSLKEKHRILLISEERSAEIITEMEDDAERFNAGDPDGMDTTDDDSKGTGQTGQDNTD